MTDMEWELNCPLLNNGRVRLPQASRRYRVALEAVVAVKCAR